MRFSTCFFLLLLVRCPIPAQIPGDWIDANSVHAQVLGNGALFGDVLGGKFLVPVSAEDDSNRLSLFARVTPWAGGIDPGGNLKVAAGGWSQGNSDFRAGLFGAPGLNQIWRVTKAEILTHLADFQDNGIIDNPIPSIMNWPGTLLLPPQPGAPPELLHVAPYQDISFSGMYDPAHGDYPLPTDLLGDLPSGSLPDQMLFFGFHDSCAHVAANGKMMKLQVLCTVYAYSCPEDPIINNTVFAYYQFWNRDYERLDSLYFGFFLDPNIGNANDDYLFSNQEGTVFGAYNADNFDEGQFLLDPPLAAIMTLVGPNDGNGGNVEASSFLPVAPGPASPGSQYPTAPAEFYNYLTGSFRDGTPLTVGGSGYNPGSLEQTYFAFPDTPGVAGGWSEASAGNLAGNRRAVVSYGPISLNPNHLNHLLVAFTWQRTSPAGPLSGYELLLDRVKWLRYEHLFWIDPPLPKPGCLSFTLPVQSPTPEISLMQAFPNPADQFIRVDLQEKHIRTLRIFDLMGRSVSSTIFPHQDTAALEVPTAPLPAGLYFLEALTTTGQRFTARFTVAH